MVARLPMELWTKICSFVDYKHDERAVLGVTQYSFVALNGPLFALSHVS